MDCIRVYYPVYLSSQSERQKELDYCLKANSDNNDFKLILLHGNTRPNYHAIFSLSNFDADPNTINVMTNADIELRDIGKLRGNVGPDDFICLSRWELDLPYLSPISHQSQDVWAWRGVCRIAGGDFPLGTPGCDNAIAYHAKQAGYTLRNPALDVRVFHHHRSNHRTYTKSEKVTPPYEFVKPSRL